MWKVPRVGHIHVGLFGAVDSVLGFILDYCTHPKVESSSTAGDYNTFWGYIGHHYIKAEMNVNPTKNRKQNKAKINYTCA